MSSEAFQAGLERVRERIRSTGVSPANVRILPITKGHGPEAVRVALSAGFTAVGESYVQELQHKAELVDGVEWHFVGGLQRNKVRHAAPFVSLWQSIDRLALAGEVARRAPGAAVLVQVNVTGAEQQGGCAPERTAAVVEGCADLGLEVRGLMTIGPIGTPGEQRTAFATLRTLADRLDLPERSMGMSNDLEAAVAEGATMVRIGTALFGPRGRTAAVGN